ncbi:MAG: proton-conducting transporter membrane subunit [Candidatus Bathyarchaeia archaeon]
MYSLFPLLSVMTPLSIGILHLILHPFWFLEQFFKKAHKILLLFGASLTLTIILSMVPYVLAGEILEVPHLALYVDSRNIVGLIGVALIFFLTSIYNVEAEKGGRLKPTMYNFFLMLFLCCMLGLLLSYDLFGIFLFVELTIGVSVILVAHNPSKLSTEAAFKYLIITAVSALFVLLGVLIIFFLAGSTNLFIITSNPDTQARLVENSHLLMLAVACFIIGLGADIGIVPFHGWLPDVFPGSTIIINGFFCSEPIALILALYNLVAPFYRIYPSNTIIMLMAGLGLLSMVFGALVAYSQKNFYRMLAYCSIDEFGHIVFVLGLLTSPMSFIVGQFYLVNSAMMKAGMILSLGSVFFKVGTADMQKLGGLLGKMNKTALSYIICALSLAGVPPLSGFYAKWLLYSVAYNFLLELGGITIAVVTLIFLICISLITFVFLLRSFHHIFMGEATETTKEASEAHWTMWFPTVVLALTSVILGLQPQILLNLIGVV